MEVLKCKKCGHIEQSTYDGLACPECGGEFSSVRLEDILRKQRENTEFLYAS